ncbi:DUF924 family protein [Frateuria sp. YIM B11624]|uniref:DUF924 family protein n=1 Tax=Frateuria sp. YIM B11624 TaxID=3143185 RepID=UPI003C72952D
MIASAQEVLQFWFADENAVRWFVRDPGFDQVIRERFSDTLEAAAVDALDSWTVTPHGWLALLIVLDQFSRNIYRGEARAFEQDTKAQALVLEGLERRDDEALAPLERVFAYLPLEHAEDLGLQWRSVTLFRALSLQASPQGRGQYEGFLDYARRHCEVVARYGRFPHRNAALGRPSSPDELAYLAEGGGF